MIKHTILGFIAIAATAVVLGATAQTASITKADDGTTSTASVTFTLPEDSKIAIKSIPNIDFGSDTVNTSGQTMQAQTIDAPVIVDNPGFGDGWAVAVNASQFTDDNKSVNLNGAAITFTNGTVAATTDTNVSAKPEVQQITVEAGADAKILLNAKSGAGVGEYSATFANSEVSLDIPAGNVAANYTSALTWTLTDAVM